MEKKSMVFHYHSQLSSPPSSSPVIDHDVLVEGHMRAPWQSRHPVRHVQLVRRAVLVEHVHQLMVTVMKMVVMMMVKVMKIVSMVMVVMVTKKHF